MSVKLSYPSTASAKYILVQPLLSDVKFIKKKIITFFCLSFDVGCGGGEGGTYMWDVRDSSVKTVDILLNCKMSFIMQEYKSLNTNWAKIYIIYRLRDEQRKTTMKLSEKPSILMVCFSNTN